MKWLYCWRCDCDVPMLEDVEYDEIHPLLVTGLQMIKEERITNDQPLNVIKLHDVYRPFLDAFEKLTGYIETNPNAITHHRISMYGEACANCGKPLRTPKASRCMACGATKST
jgi:hypothetical protein